MKVTVVGAGHVGATAADCLARKDLVDEVVLIDIVEGLAKGKALDIQESAPIHLFDTRVVGGSDYSLTRDSDVCIITAGRPRKPGMSRDDLLTINAGIVRHITEQLVTYSPNTILIVVTNPLDVMTYVAYMTSGFPSHRVMGMAGVLDTARYRAFLAEALEVSVKDIQALILGTHGDTMVPLPRFTTVAGTPVTDLLPADTIEAIAQRTRFGGGEIVELMGTSAWYAPGAAAAEMCEAILKDSNRILPASVWMTGQYGIEGIFLGMPIKLGRSGVKDILELKLNDEELAALKKAGEHVRGMIDRLAELEAQQS